MTYTTASLYKNVKPQPQVPVVVGAAANTVVIPANFLPNYEVAFILLYNAGGGTAYINFGGTCDNATNWSAIIPVNGMYALPMNSQVSVYSLAGCTIGICVGVRDPQSLS